MPRSTLSREIFAVLYAVIHEPNALFYEIHAVKGFNAVWHYPSRLSREQRWPHANKEMNKLIEALTVLPPSCVASQC